MKCGRRILGSKGLRIKVSKIEIDEPVWHVAWVSTSIACSIILALLMLAFV